METTIKNFTLSKKGDWLLDTLVGFIEGNKNKNLSIPISLYCNGMVVYGKLISFGDYLRSLGEEVTENFAPEMKDFVLSKFTDGASSAEKLTEDQESDFNYIHLKDVFVFTSDFNIGNYFKATVWRGRLSEITGFSFTEPK